MTNNQYEREDLEDFRTKDRESTLWLDDPIEKDARRLYTINIFSEFNTQLRVTTGYKLNELEKDSLYKISPISHPSSSRQRIDVIEKSCSPELASRIEVQGLPESEVCTGSTPLASSGIDRLAQSWEGVGGGV
ncbi:hypothetical protein ACMD2_15163 [Ananas comosus]|uniref:Uncharacterized protein n=1 Tax=Ananas comosus TaxID=4615 RepID=A0A199V5Z4_ANACO|nr:hypothetical protein ACMD2_15163 [Ananas comosus]